MTILRLKLYLLILFILLDEICVLLWVFCYVGELAPHYYSIYFIYYIIN